MGKSIEKRKEKYSSALLHVVEYSVIPLLAFMLWVIFVPIFLFGGMITSVDNAQNMQQTVIVFSLPMLLFFAILPVVSQLKRGTEKINLGLKLQKNKKNIIINTVNLCIMLLAFSYVFQQINLSLQEFLPMIIQLIAIGISEEVLCRGIIYYEIRNAFDNKIIAIVLSSLIFAFLFHSGDSDMANLIIRFPLGLILATVRCYTGNVYGSIEMHIWYNTIMLIL